MIVVTRANILTANVEAIVNPVNCVGVMGKGVALEFKRAYPGNFVWYKNQCESADGVRPGFVYVYHMRRRMNPRYIINFPTKRHWRDNSRMEDIDSGLVALVDTVKMHGIKSIAIPALGCGLGGLRWADVRPRIERAFADVTGVDVYILEPRA